MFHANYRKFSVRFREVMFTQREEDKGRRVLRRGRSPSVGKLAPGLATRCPHRSRDIGAITPEQARTALPFGLLLSLKDLFWEAWLVVTLLGPVYAHVLPCLFQPEGF